MSRLYLDPATGAFAACSFCGVPRPERRTVVRASGETPKICEVCLGDCVALLGEDLAAVRMTEAPTAPAIEGAGFLLYLETLTREIETLRDSGTRMPTRAGARCSFCSEASAFRLVSGPRVYICETCVDKAAHLALG